MLASPTAFGKLFRRIGGGARRQSGAGLIEVLVSLLLASIALVSMAGLSAAGIRYAKMSQYRATATMLANDFGERLRANKFALTNPASAPLSVANRPVYEFNTLSFSAQQESANLATLPTGAGLCNTVAISCTPDQLATLDLAQWRRIVRDQLPQGSVFSEFEDGDLAMDVWIAWRDPALAGDDESPDVGVQECHADLGRGTDKSIRCSYFRIAL